MPVHAAYDEAAEARHRVLRREFVLDPEWIFLNHGSHGARARPVFARYQQWQAEMERQPVAFLSRRIGGLLAEARGALAAYLGAGADEVVYHPNVTTALNVVARSLPLAAGDEVLTTDHEYGALDRTWRFICAKRGARCVVRPLPAQFEDADAVVEAVWSGVTPRTRVLFLSHITSFSALRLPIAPLIARARDAGIWSVIDGAHAVGQIPLDLQALGADFYGGNCHKWLCAPPGAGFLYARRDLQPLIEPLMVGWGWQARDPGPSAFIDEQERQGTRDYSAYLSVPAAIAYQAERDWPRVRAECHELVRYARTALTELTGLPPLSADSPDWFSQMVTAPLPPCNGAALAQRLRDDYRIEIPVIRWQDRDFIRVSAQGYTTRAEIDALLAALAELLPRVR
ncbi:MAG TPA: aminotransferase class V-fold PLP-dependent enzyme [Dehalococcoidia bacterium]|nr:aminotransferase class V-fold PLP-dependent enzyme [Dehalococcoidia bacterium]